MSFSITKDEMYERKKSVTRRLGWWSLRPGDIVMAVEKAMGLKKGERMKKIYPIEVVSVRTERLADIKQEDLALEGFPEMTTSEFVEMFCALHKAKGCTPETLVNRVEFRPLESGNKTVS